MANTLEILLSFGLLTSFDVMAVMTYGGTRL